MSQPFLQEISCPGCLSPLTRQAGRDQADCPACGKRVALTGRLCPACSTYHDAPDAICRHCTNLLRRTCAHCQAVNWSGDSECLACGAPLDTLATITERQRRAADPFQADKRAQIRDLKRQEALASSQRMAEFQAIEEARLARVHARREQNRRREQRILRVGLLVIGAAFIIVLLSALFAALN